MPRRYRVARVIRGDITDLESSGFILFYPEIDEYVFLDSKDPNIKSLVKKEETLGIKFHHLGSVCVLAYSFADLD